MRKKVLFPEGLIKVHENKDLVRVEIRRQFYRQLEEAAKRLETTPDKLIHNAILLIIKMESAVRARRLR